MFLTKMWKCMSNWVSCYNFNTKHSLNQHVKETTKEGLLYLSLRKTEQLLQ